MEQISFEKYRQIFKDGLNSLPMLDSHLRRGAMPVNAAAAAIDMGGTNLRIASVFFDEKGEAGERGMRVVPSPGTLTETDADSFFSFFAELLADYPMHDVGFCFSHPIEIQNDGDARIIEFAKGVRVRGAEGCIIGCEINRRLERMGKSSRHFVLMNDTTAVQLGSRNADMGMILGTGFNISFTKNDDIIDPESGLFRGFPTEPFDVGDAAEMQVSGAYLKNVISNAGEDAAFDRAAKIVAAELCVLAEYAGLKAPVIAAEGSVFWNVEKLRSRILHYLDESGLKYTISDGRNRILTGAAAAALNKEEK